MNLNITDPVLNKPIRLIQLHGVICLHGNSWRITGTSPFYFYLMNSLKIYQNHIVTKLLKQATSIKYASVKSIETKYTKNLLHNEVYRSIKQILLPLVDKISTL